MLLISASLTYEDVYNAAKDLGFEAHGLTNQGVRRGGKWRGKRVLSTLLRPGPNMVKGSELDDRYRAISAGYFGAGRRIWAINWEGHRDFMRAIFEIDPACI